LRNQAPVAQPGSVGVGKRANWLDEKRKARQSCRLVGESRTGKTVACEAYTFRNKPKQEGKQAPTVPVVYSLL